MQRRQSALDECDKCLTQFYSCAILFRYLVLVLHYISPSSRAVYGPHCRLHVLIGYLIHHDDDDDVDEDDIYNAVIAKR